MKDNIEFLKPVNIMDSDYMVKILPVNSKSRDNICEHLNSKFVKHFKHHDDLKKPFNYIYEIIAIGSYSEDHDQKMVVYRSVNDNKVCIRPYEMFFSKVDKIKYPDVKQKYRFESFTLKDYWRCRKNCEESPIYFNTDNRFIIKDGSGNYWTSDDGTVWNKDKSITTTI